MKRFLASALILGASTFGMVGCEDTNKTETKSSVETPGGTTEIKKTEEVTKSGDSAPAVDPTAPAPAPATPTP